MQAWSDEVRREGKRIGLVPTMGCLHEGHLSLIRLAREQTDGVVVSIFVNPTQFGPAEDFEKYPRTFERDRKLVEQAGGEVIFAPGVEEMYPPGFCTAVQVERLTKGLCGASRPGHFRGVTTVVAKLLCVAKPHVAVFGQKDFQQAQVIKQTVKDLNMNVRVKILPIVREPDGLAMSSRNKYLNDSERKEALVLYKSLREAKRLIRDGCRNTGKIKKTIKKTINTAKYVNIEYIKFLNPDTLKPVEKNNRKILVAIAARVGKAMLIDNVVVS
ncbi:MAG: pantoate--beta-alanine ligase [Candidatus Omnitrophica bacterium]|nr:pantoate--beta-alanine ligase [Candidatus Omnitrophota bacterium]